MEKYGFSEVFFAGAKLGYASIFFMQFEEKLSSIMLKLIEIQYENRRYSPKLPGIFLYFYLVTLCNMFLTCISKTDFG